MTVNMFMMIEKPLLKLIIGSAAFLLVTGCATWPTAAPPPKPISRPRPKPVDAKAQRQYYDQGLKHYSKENYGEAKEAFERVVDLGPNTALGMKSRENLKKIQQILKTLEEIESK